RAGMPVSNTRTAEPVDVSRDPGRPVEDLDGVEVRLVGIHTGPRIDLDAGGADRCRQERGDAPRPCNRASGSPRQYQARDSWAWSLPQHEIARFGEHAGR